MKNKVLLKIIALIIIIMILLRVISMGAFASATVAVFLTVVVYQTQKKITGKFLYEEFGELSLLGGQIYSASFFKHDPLIYMLNNLECSATFVGKRSIKSINKVLKKISQEVTIYYVGNADGIAVPIKLDMLQNVSKKHSSYRYEIYLKDASTIVIGI